MSTAQLPVHPEAPWLGLQPFTEAASQYFFGRTAELAELYERVTAQPLTLLFGPSGFGKSSLLQAALAPRLRDTGFVPVLVRLRHDNNASSLEQQVFRELGAATQGLGMHAERAPSLWCLLHDPEYGFCLPGAPRLVLILDQFEEIFTIGQSPDRARQSEVFLSILADLIENRVPEAVKFELAENEELADRIDYAARPARLLLSMREDYLYQLERHRAAMPSMMDNRMELRLLNGQQALQATVEPGRIRCHLNPELRPIVSEETSRAIVRFVSDASEYASLDDIDAVPPYFLSLLCEQLNLERLRLGQPEITAHLVSARGKDILDHYYENCFERRPKAVRRQVENHLVSKGGHRNAMVRGEFLAALHDSNVNAPELHLDELVARRLLTMEKRGGQVRVELTHDKLTSLVVRSRDKRQRARRARWVTVLGALVVVLAGLVLIFAKRASEFAKMASDASLRESQAAKDVANRADKLGCANRKEISESMCGPRERNISHAEEGCLVPFVSADPADEKAYNEVACKFWKKHGIRVNRISCKEDAFRDYRKELLTLYPGGVFTWFPGQALEPVINSLFRFDQKSWMQEIRGTWKPLITPLQDRDLGGTYAIPFKFYPWAIYYHKRFIEEHGPFKYLSAPQDKRNEDKRNEDKRNEDKRNEWTVPRTWEQLIATAKEMQSKNIPAFAFSFATGHTWTAMGTFDILNMRLHGYDAHEKLMRGTLQPTQKEAHLEALFRHWAELVPFYINSWSRDTVENSAKELKQGEAGMYLTGAFFLKYIEENDRKDFGLFDFPRIETPTNANVSDIDAIDAPIDTFVISATTDSTKLACAKALLTFLGTDEAAFQTYNAKNGLYLSVNEKALNQMTEPTQDDTPQRQAAHLLMDLKTKTIAGFTDRRVWGLEGRAVTPALKRFLEAAYYEPRNVEDAIRAAIREINVIAVEN